MCWELPDAPCCKPSQLEKTILKASPNGAQRTAQKAAAITIGAARTDPRSSSFLLRQLLEELTFTKEKINELDQRIQQCMLPHHHAISLWTSMPGIRMTTAWSLVAEIGTTPEQFPQGSNLASWAGMCPGNNESAGRRKSGKTRRGNRWLRRALNQAAWAAARTSLPRASTA